MNLTHVGAYLAVLDTGGFRAAAGLRVIQGAMSQQIGRKNVKVTPMKYIGQVTAIRRVAG